MGRASRLPLITIPILALLGACDTTTPTRTATLSPAPEASAAAGGRPGAKASESGVEITAVSSGWTGGEQVRQQVTPIRLRIDNDSANPILVQYADLRLIAPDGTTYRALPLYKIAGTVDRPRVMGPYDPIANPAFRGSGFAVAPYYGSIYPGSPAYRGRMFYDAGFYNAYDASAMDRSLPTAAMRQNALPEGVLSPGGEVEGWVYFEKVPASELRVTLRADFQDSRTGRTLTEVRIPFDVES